MDTIPGLIPSEYKGLLHQLDRNLLGQEGEEWQRELKRFLCKEPCWSSGDGTHQFTETGRTHVLEFVGTVDISATSSRFLASKEFVRDRGPETSVKIKYLSEDFAKWFLSGDGKTENKFAENKLRYYRLREFSLDMPIIAELGGEDKSETMLAQMFSLMKTQGKGEDGALLTNGYANIFSIQDRNGVRRRVYCRWRDDGWHVYAYPTAYPFKWRDGSQVFSPDPVLKVSITAAV